MKAPMARSSPWARFSILLDLKIITKPRAERAYRNPRDRPLIKS
jgi:hypothetical protein